MQAIEAGLASFAEDVPWLMRGLDDVLKLHPAFTGMYPRVSEGRNNF